MKRVGDHAGQARGVQQTFFEIELPSPGLLRHEPALKPVGEAGDHPVQAGELLVEQLAQAGQFVWVAQFVGLDDLVELGHEHMIGVFARGVAPVVELRRASRAAGLLRRAAGDHVTIGFGGLIVAGLAVAGLAQVTFDLAAAFGLLAVAAVAAGVRRMLVRVLTLALGLVFVQGILLGRGVQVQMLEQTSQILGEGGLIADVLVHQVKVLKDLGIELGPPQVDHGPGRRRRRRAGQDLTGQHAQRFAQWGFIPVGDAVVPPPAIALVERGIQVDAGSRHAPDAKRFAAGLLEGIIHLTCRRIGRPAPCVQRAVVVAQAQRQLIGLAAHHRDLVDRQVAWRRGQARFLSDQAGRGRREADG